MSDLVARFLPRFAALARARITAATAVASARDTAGAAAVVRDMHALAGEAGMLGLESVLRAAREAESLAKRFSGDPSQAEPLSRVLHELQQAVADAVGGAA